MDNWRSVEPNVWKPKEAGESIVGVIVNKSPRDDTNGLSAKYQLENESGMILVWGSAVLDDRMLYVSVGSKVRITFNGKTKSKRNHKVNLFKVEISENGHDAAESPIIEEEPRTIFNTGT